MSLPLLVVTAVGDLSFTQTRVTLEILPGVHQDDLGAIVFERSPGVATWTGQHGNLDPYVQDNGSTQTLESLVFVNAAGNVTWPAGVVMEDNQIFTVTACSITVT